MRKLFTLRNLLLIVIINCSSNAFSQVVWSGATACASGAGTAWLTTTNWCLATVPTSSQVAQWGSAGTGGTIGINMNGSTNNGPNNQAIGAIEITSAKTTAITFNNSAGTVAGTLTLNGSTVNSIPNVILRNNSAANCTITNGASTAFLAIGLGNTIDNIINIDGSGGVIINSIINGSGKKLTKSGSGTGILTLAGANTFTGGTFINSGTLQLGAAGVLADGGAIVLSGGTLKTGITTGFTETAGTVLLSDNSSITLGTGVHNLSFAASNSVSWTFGKILTIKGWQGSYSGGSAGTAGKIFFGTNATSLTGAQLSQIRFSDGTNTFPAMLLASGELVPLADPIISSISPSSAVTGGSAFTLTVNGLNFVNGLSSVLWNGTARTTTFVNPSQLTASIAAADISSAGSATVSVSTTGATNTSSSQSFAINDPAVPSITTTSSLSSFGSVCLNISSSANSFTISGNNLDGTNITIAAFDGYTYSESFNGTYSTTLSFAAGSSFTDKVVYVKFKPTAVQSYNGNLIISGGGVSNYSVAAAGSGINDLAAVVTGSKTGNAISATLTASITSNGCSSPASYGFQYSTVDGFTTGTPVGSNNLLSGNFSTTLNNLNPNTTYYYKAFVTNNGGTTTGNQLSFITGGVPVLISSLEDLSYREGFSTLSSWANNFVSPDSASHFSPAQINSTGSIPDGVKITTSSMVFVSGTTGGVQKGTGNIILLSTGTSDNTTSVAFDVYLDFTGINAGSLSFDYQTISNSISSNSTNDNAGSLRVYTSTNGTSFTELTSAAVLNFINKTPVSGSKINITLPTTFNNNPNARIRFYYYNGSGSGGGSRPKISLDNLKVTGVSTTPCVTPAAAPTDLSFSNITTNSITGTFAAATPAPNKYLVVISNNSSLTSNPVDGQVYSIGDNIGDGSVVSYSSSTSFTASNLDDGTPYYFFVFSANNTCVGGPKYLTTDILSGTQTTVVALPNCTAPADQATNLTFSNTSTNSMTGTFTAATADEYLILRSTSSSLTATPANGHSYNTNDILGNALVVQRGNANTFTASELAPNTEYYFFLFSINSNNCLNGPVYNVNNPLSGSQRSLPLSPCVAPSSQPTNISMNASYNSITGTFNPSTTADDYLIIRSNSAALSALPSDNIDYNVGDNLGGGIVVANGSGSSFSTNNLSGATHYYFYVFAANRNCTGGTKYATLQPLTADITTASTPPYNYYFGNLHAHSDYSDGNKDNHGFTPADDYAYAKTAACMDFLGISEHNHFSSVDNPGNIITNYHKGSIQADQFTAANSGFLAMYGMEWGTISGGGHVVIYGDGMDKLFGWESNVGGISGPNYDVFVEKSVYTGSVGLFNAVNDNIGSNTFATLAHPNSTDYNNLSNVAYDEMADNAIVGSAVESGPATSLNTTYSNPGSSMSFLRYYQKMLSKGYHLGPTIDHDNHNTTFGKTTTARTAVIAPALTKTEIVKAMRDMHFYATEDCDTKVDFTINTQIMGSIFMDRNAPSISVKLTDASSNLSTAKIKIMYGIPGSGVIAVGIDSVTGSSLNFIDNNLANHATGYYYVDITNGTSRIVTSPIWYTRTCSVSSDTTIYSCNSYEWNGQTYSESGTYSKPGFTSTSGCDSIAFLHLIITTPTTGDTTAVACNSFTWYGTEYTSSGDIIKVLKERGGCDSTVTLHLTINPKPVVSISADGSTTVCPGSSVQLTATSAVSYLWSNSATTQTITVAQSGDYYVTITDANGCSNTSDPVKVNVEDITPPEVRTKNIEVSLGADGTVTISTTQINNGSSDNCSIAEDGYSLNKASFDCSNVGVNTVTLTVTDVNGNIASGNATVTVSDNLNPTITAPEAVSVSADNGNCSSSNVVLGTPTSFDNCSVASVTNNAPESFPVGATTVTWTVTDTYGNTSTANQTVTVTDNQAPVITMNGNKSLNSDPDHCGAMVPVSATAADNCTVGSPAGTRNDNLLLTDEYPVGTTTITWTVTDVNGNSAIPVTQTITVLDNQKPSITAPAPISVPADNGSCSAVVSSLGAPVTTDNCRVVSVTNNHSSTTYPVGTTTVTWTVTDNHGNTASTTQTVTVSDDENPTITAPASFSVNADNGSCAATNITLGTPIYADNCSANTPTNNAPASFPVGPTVVTWTVTDSHGHSASATQTITVIDNQKPTISCVTNQVRNVNNANCTYKVAGTEFNPLSYADNCSVTSIRNNFNNSNSLVGAVFPKGTTNVIWTVTDAHSNTSSCTTSITVNSTLAIGIPDVYAVQPGGAVNTLYIGYGPTSVNLNAVVSGGTAPYSYKWTAGSSAGPALGTNASYKASPSATTTYYLNVKDVYGCTVAYATKTIKVVDIRCGAKMDKVTVCVYQKGTYTTTCVTNTGNTINNYLNSGSYLGACNSPMITSTARTTQEASVVYAAPIKTIASFVVKALPNPTTSSFTLRVESASPEAITIKITDVAGRRIKTILASKNESITFGNNFIGGTYYAEVVQGKNHQTIKLVKL